VNYRVNAGFIPKDHWTQTDEGGGRILGEVCHFVDFLQFITGGIPQKVFAACVSNANSKMRNEDNVSITVSFADGSIGLITYLACGDKLLAKERIEIFGGGKTFIINDFRDADVYLNGRHKNIKAPGKGHMEEVELFVRSIRDGLPWAIPLESILYTTATTFRILDSLRTGLAQEIDLP
jgi:polar amino acid transport system substrate-binding protein